MRHLLSLDDLDRDALGALMERAGAFQDRPGDRCRSSGALGGRRLANLFFEPSTRTRASMEVAAQNLGMQVLNLDMGNSSRVKGESLSDTARTIAAMGVDLIAVRDAEAGTAAGLAAAIDDDVGIINCGEGSTEHPTQGLLDLLTVQQTKGDPATLSICIAGDLRHSRVARSACRAFTMMGCADLRLAAPEAWMPDPGEMPEAHRHTSLDQAVTGADVVMMLRVQRERLSPDEAPDTDDYIAGWQLTPERLAAAAEDAVVMHPGPMNRGVEIHDAVADGPASVILRQVSNGVAVRMAVISTLMESRL